MQLSPNQEKAALLLATGMKQKDVATNTDVTPATLCNWRQMPEFNAAMNRNLTIMLGGARDRLIGLSGATVDSLNDLLNSENEHIKLQACKIALSANGLVGDNERSFMRYGWGIAPEASQGLSIDNLLKKGLG